MNLPILSSTFLLTLLLMVGLFFFIRASAKDRTKTLTLVSEEPLPLTLTQIQQYFESRAYRVIEASGTDDQITLEGFVRPSWFIAIFVTVLAACGWFCLALVLSFLLPSWSQLFLGLVLLAPLAGVYYWKKAGRVERVSLQGKTSTDNEVQGSSLITVIAHRDELLQLQQAIPLQPVE